MMFRRRRPVAEAVTTPKYPGIPSAIDGSTAIVEMETAASEAAGAYPITPSTQMGEGWALAVAADRPNVNGRKLIFFEPEGEHAAAAVTAGLSMTGLRATNFSSGQGIAYMHESLYAAVGKRLTYVLNVAARAMTKHALNVHAGHDDYHCVDDTGFFQVFAKNVQESADLNLIAHRVAELSLNPGLVAQDGFLTSHVIESVRLPERELVREFLGDPADLIDAPTPAQRMVFGPTRRRIPELFDLDYPAMLGVVQNQDSYAQGVAAQRPFYFDHVAALMDRACEEYAALTGRRYARATGYRLDDADFVLIGQGSVVANAEAVCDWLRARRGIRVGVLNVTMFRPFPADLISELLRGVTAATVLERTDQPLAVDPPLLREIRAAMGKALENSRSGPTLAHAGVAACRAEEIPDFYSGCFGLGSRDLQPGHLVAAVENMLPDGEHRRQFYLGIDFIRAGTRLPKLELWQGELQESYPHLARLALPSAENIDLMPAGSLSVRIHSVGGWGAITMGKNLALTASDLLGLTVQANPKYGSEKKGQPTTFYATLAREPIRTNCELRHVDVVLSPDPNVFRHSNPLAGLPEGGVFVVQSAEPPEDLWASLPVMAQRLIHQRKLALWALDGFAIAGEEATDPELRYRMQGAAFLGAFFRAAPLMRREGLSEEQLFEGIRAQLKKKFGHLGEAVVEANVRVIRRGFDEARAVDCASLAVGTELAAANPVMPAELATDAQPGIANPGRFWEQVCHLYKTGQDGIADPFAALSAIPAATSTIRDMTDVRFEVPDFVASRCTGCGQCWTQCPDAAIPGVVSDIDAVITAAMAAAPGGPFNRLRQIVPHLARESRRLMASGPFTVFGDTLGAAYASVLDQLKPDPERRSQLDREFAPVAAALAEFPLARTAPFFDVPESRAAGSGGLLSITVNPEACKGCNLCVEVCPDQALVTIRQDAVAVARLRRNWALWQRLPETPDRYINISSYEEGIGVLPSLLLKQSSYRSMFGGDGACMGCGEKTGMHLVLSAVNALMLPRVERHVARLDDLIARLDRRARELLAAEADLGAVRAAPEGGVAIPLGADRRDHVTRINGVIDALKDLKWRYTAGPGGKGRASLGMVNSTGCSSVWGSTYPFNPYPFPWVNHLFQDAPSIAIGLFEGHMRRMADGFAAVRRAELELEDRYDAERDEPFFRRFDWRQFTDEEFMLCPPIVTVGGDGAMLDIGFQNLSRLLASGKPIRVIVLDTQVYSNTGGQACTSGFFGQVSDMAAFGSGQRGKEETRKELALLAIAHRGAYVLQASQAAPSHLLGGVLRALQARRPAVMILHCPCPPEHGLADEGTERAARLTLESRAFPLVEFNPDGGPAMADQLSLDGNPALDEPWPSYEMTYLDEAGAERTMTVPVTTADWAATELRFRKHFRPARDDDEDLVPFHEFVAAAKDDREGRRPFVYVIGADRRLARLVVSPEIVMLAEERLTLWSLLRQMAGLELPPAVRESAVEPAVAGVQAEYEARIADLRATWPGRIARRLAEGLIRSGNGKRTIAELLAEVEAMPGLEPPAATPTDAGAASGASVPAAAPAAGAAAAAPTAAPTPAASAPAAEQGLSLEAWIETERCTTCDECTRLNGRLFAYNDKKQAYIKDPKAGTFKDLVMAAEKCPAGIIHPGTPLNPKEKDLPKWLKRAERFA